MRWTHELTDTRIYHKWFAWYPVYCDNYTVWLEIVWRRETGNRGCSGDITWEYAVI